MPPVVPMAMKKKVSKNSAEDNTSLATLEAEDACLEESPFASASTIAINFRHGKSLQVHQGIIDQHPGLEALLDIAEGLWNVGKEASALKHISRSAGHVFVNYLYKSTYGTRKWIGGECGEKETIMNFRTALEVYSTARKFKLSILEDLAKEQISHLSQRLDPTTIIDIVSQAYPSLGGNDTWFPTFVKGVVRKAFEQPIPAQEGRFDDTKEAPRPPVDDISGTHIAKILLQSTVDVFHDMTNSMAATFREKTEAMEDSFEQRLGTCKICQTTESTTMEESLLPSPPMDEHSSPESAVVVTREEVDPVAEVMGIEPEKSQEIDNLWSFGVTSTKKKKKAKNAILADDPSPQLAVQPGAEVLDSEAKQKEKENELWLSLSTTTMRKKKKMKPTVQPEPEISPLSPPPEEEKAPEPVLEVVKDPWDISTTGKKKKKKAAPSE